MKTARTVHMGVWFLMGLNLLMALGSIWIFMRMAPAIEVIIDRNELSLEACEEMLSSLALMGTDGAVDGGLKDSFLGAMERVENNITETKEPGALQAIHTNFSQAFAGDVKARHATVTAITLLAGINRDAMIRADLRARQFGYAGAWAIVFMAATVFFAGMLFKRRLSKNLLVPMGEIEAVVRAHQNGDIMRRCTGADVPGEVQNLFDGVNELLDKIQFQTVATGNFRAWF
ncbi:hypothetical protein SAMN02746065_11944 [Desulfocicer vacuolatum DSM 3385]|uniref:HAMP domain-containing protein n=1 Tax=Desulfocicer vacuolatum DSM 3385 TaxID=1121400 RepID=A0A1W2DQL4_9BACT|nr:hypothetical protein [Desulfocicer vacuolatum]SMC99322.1 hypothetical protein SAMN02746065_11944 [Desulfocicer vacuolatum DSM 3385]